MNFREYKIGSRMFAVALGGSMCITLLLPSLDIASVDATEISMDKQLTGGLRDRMEHLRSAAAGAEQAGQGRS